MENEILNRLKPKIMKYLALCFLFLIQVESNAQQGKNKQNRIDSLKRQLLSTAGKDRLAIISELNLAFRDSLYEVALEYASEYYKLAFTLGDSIGTVNAGRMRAYFLVSLGKNEEAVQVLTMILGTARRNQQKYPELNNQLKFTLNNMGLAYLYLGNYDKALDFHYQSLKMREEEGDKTAIRNSYNNIGLV
jgi:tetratricopeptide (TPR) repeat protein